MSDEYVMHCILCNTTIDLRMFPQRINGDMVGWIFSCDAHEDHEIPEIIAAFPKTLKEKPEERK